MSAAADARDRADSLLRSTLSLRDATLRARYFARAARSWPIAVLAQTLDALCERAERAEAPAREVLVAIVDAFNGPEMAEVVQRLREEAVGESLLALERLVRHPQRAPNAIAQDERARMTGAGSPAGAGLPIEAGGRVRTLGERKWLARRPDRGVIESLLRDRHPAVVARCLRNPRVTEEDVVRLSSRRPGRAEVLIEVARSTWVHRPRVRLALALNGATPIEIAVRISGLLLRAELELVVGSTTAAPALRAVCLEHLERRPPFKIRDEHAGMQ